MKYDEKDIDNLVALFNNLKTAQGPVNDAEAARKQYEESKTITAFFAFEETAERLSSEISAVLKEAGGEVPGDLSLKYAQAMIGDAFLILAKTNPPKQLDIFELQESFDAALNGIIKGFLTRIKENLSDPRAMAKFDRLTRIKENLSEPRVFLAKFEREASRAVSKALEDNRFRRSSIDDILPYLSESEKQLIAEEKIRSVGVDLSMGRDQALEAIQTIMSKSIRTNPRSNKREYVTNCGREEKSVTIFYDKDGHRKEKSITLPVIRFTLSEYLEAFGVNKKSRSDGRMEYDPVSYENAIFCLETLRSAKYIIKFDYTDSDHNFKGKGTKEKLTYQRVRPLFYLDYVYYTDEFGDETPDDGKRIKGKKIKYYFLEPSPIMLLCNRFIMKENNLLQKIKAANPRHLEPFKDFIHRLYKFNSEEQAKNGWRPVTEPFNINYRLLAGQLQSLNRLVDRREWGKVRKILTECYQDAVANGWLLNFEVDHKGKTNEHDIIILNPEAFYFKEDENNHVEDLRVNGADLRVNGADLRVNGATDKTSPLFKK